MSAIAKRISSFVALLVVLSGALPASANTIIATFKAVDYGSNMHFYRNAYGQSANEYVSVGAYRWNGAVTNESPWNVNGFYTFCIDFVQNIGFNVTYTFDKIALKDAPKNYGVNTGNPPAGMGVNIANAIKQLWGTNYSDLSVGDATVKAAKTAGFQMAIWELIYETNSQTLLAPSAYNVTTGNFRNTDLGLFTAAKTYAFGYLASIFDINTGALKTNALANLEAFASEQFQDQVVLAPGNNIEAAVVVPTPTSAVGGGVLLVVAAAMTLRRKLTLA